MVQESGITKIADTCIDSYYPNKNFSNLIVSWVGQRNCLSEFRYLLRFSLGCIPKAAEIIACRLMLYVDQAQDKSVTGIFTPYLIASNWSCRAVTWATQPHIYESIHSQGIAVGNIGWYQWDITSLFNKWHTGAYLNYGIMLKSDGLYDNDNKRIISSRNYKSAFVCLRPSITVQYNLPARSEEVFISGRRFTEHSLIAVTGDSYQHTMGFNTTQQSNTTIFVKNTDLFPAEVFVEVSPNNTDYVADGPSYPVLPDETIALVPRHFSKYAHIAYKSKEPGKSTQLEITMQAQV